MAVRKAMFLALLLLPQPVPAGASSEGEVHPPGCVGSSCHHPPPPSGAHPPASEGECTACHRPEGGYSVERHSLESFDRGFAERRSCLGCHDGVRQLAESPLLLHEPFRDGPCTACHEAHRSSIPPLLREAYPPSPYSSFDRDAYALCWACHDSTLATDKFSERATSFRLGRRNFHFSHLQKRRGMTCRACHLPHGGPQPILVRDVAPANVKGWIDTMSFRRDVAGGRCSGGCHKDISYRR